METRNQISVIIAELEEAHRNNQIHLTEVQRVAIRSANDIATISATVEEATGWPILHTAVLHGLMKTVAMLSKDKSYANSLGRGGIGERDKTPLHCVVGSLAKSKKIEMLTTLLTSEANPNATKKDGTTALIMAARHGKIDQIKILLEHGADPKLVAKLGGLLTTKESYLDAFFKSSKTMTPIVDLFYQMYNESSAKLLKGNDVPLTNFISILNASLEASNENTRIEFLTELIKRFHAEKNKTNIGKVIQFVDAKYNKEFNKALKKASHDSEEDKGLGLISAVLKQDYGEYHVIFQKITDEQIRELNALHIKLRENQQKQAKATEEKVASEAAATEKKEQEAFPIHALIEKNDIDADKLKKLLKTNDIDGLRDSDRHSALSLSVKTNNWDIVVELLKNKANPNLLDAIRDNPDTNILHFAIVHFANIKAPHRIEDIINAIGPIACMHMMMDKHEGNTPLQLAIKKGLPIQKFLEVMNEDQINIKDGNGNTALNTALEKKNWAYVELLLNKKTHNEKNQEQNIAIAIDRQTVALARENPDIMEKLFFAAARNPNVEPEARIELFQFIKENNPAAMKKLLISAAKEGDTNTVAFIIDNYKYISLKDIFPTEGKDRKGVKPDKPSIISQLFEDYFAGGPENVDQKIGDSLKTIAKLNPLAFYKECKNEWDKLDAPISNTTNQDEKINALMKQLKICELGREIAKEPQTATKFTQARTNQKYGFFHQFRSKNLDERFSVRMEKIKEKMGNLRKVRDSSFGKGM